MNQIHLSLTIIALVSIFGLKANASGNSNQAGYIQHSDTCITPVNKVKDEEVSGDLYESASSVVTAGSFGADRKTDSLYANDVVMERDIQIPARGNRIIQLPSFICSEALLEISAQLIEAGNYDWIITDSKGNIVSQKEVSVIKGMKNLALQFPKLSAGEYSFQLRNKASGKKLIEPFSVK